jgi:hypothetical protein
MNRPLPLLTADCQPPYKGLQRQAAQTSLHLRNFVQGFLIPELGLHPCNEGFITSVHLVPEFVPEAGLGLSVADELGKPLLRRGSSHPEL